MSEERKKHVWPWVVAVSVCLPILYVASFGPACWITSRLDRGADLLPVVYRPFTWSMSEIDTAISRVIMWYADLGAAENWLWGAVWEAGETPGSEYARWDWFETGPGPP